MANDLAKIQETQYQRFPMLIADGVARTEWRRVAGEPLTGKGPLLQRSSLSGTSHFTAQTEGSDPTAEALDTVKNTITSVTYEKLHVLTRAQRRHNPELPNEITNMMVDGALSTIANLYWTAFDTVATTAHPGDQAPYLGGGGGAAYFADTFTAPNAQSNLLTTALSASSLGTAIATMQDYLNRATIPANINMAPSNLLLVVGSALRQTAYDLVDAGGSGGGTTESGFFKGIEVAVDNYQIDSNDWSLVAKSRRPVKMWIPQAPQYTIEERLGHIYFYCEFEAAAVLEPDEAGLIHNAVA
jgi:hypothetical protein